VTSPFRSVTDTIGAVAKLASRIAAIGLLVAATWDDDDPVDYDPLISD
jgi:hypothetical protein